jgi:anhydro-N-acetylmuramic acid kinase
MQEITVIGLMSGTSLDGIDAAAITTNGVEVVEIGPALTLPYEPELRERLRKAVMSGSLGDDAELERDMTIAHSEAVLQLDETYNIRPDLIGFHGQTIAHRPEEGFTWQIGDGKLLAQLTGIDVVNDFRSADVKAGGQGAPLVPAYHMALAVHIDGALAILNIGGVANVTWIGENEEMLAFDVGPGNAMINDVAKAEFGCEYDDAGKLARQGEVDSRILKEYMRNPFFAKRPPKSLDRNAFDIGLVAGLEAHDKLATLTQFTVAGIVKATRLFPANVGSLYVTGGGRHNEFMMNLLRAELGSVVKPIEELGLNGDALEAQAFAYLAARVLYELPITFPSTTGCRFSPFGNAASIHCADISGT